MNEQPNRTASEAFKRTATAVAQIDAAVRHLGRYFPAPVFGAVPGGEGWRHASKDDLLASYMKCIYICSALHASCALLLNGFAHEVYILCRGVDEAGEDIRVLAIPRGKDAKTDQLQVRLLEDFFQEEFEQSAQVSFMVSAKRDRVSRSDIHAALMKLEGAEIDPSTLRVALNTVHKVFSGFVHGAYVHIMDTFDGRRFHLRGMGGTPRLEQAEEAFSYYVYRAFLAVRVVAKRTGDGELDARLKKVSDEFAKAADCY
jgi:hypothetical protein